MYKPEIIRAILAGRVELLLVEEQKVSPTMGFAIVMEIKNNSKISPKCARKSQLKAIQEEGVLFFLDYFLPNQVIFGLGVDPFSSPCIYQCKNEIIYGSHWNGYRRGVNHPILLVDN